MNNVGLDARAIAPIARDTIRAQVYNELKRALLSGVFEPGQVIVARVIAEQMGVGLMPVRESIQQLVTEGGLELLPSRTIRVPTLSVQDLDEIFEIRLKLESLAAAKAAAQINGEQVEQIRRLARDVTGPKDDVPVAASLAANYAFHFKIYELANAPHLYGIIERLWLKVGPLLILPYHASGATRDSFFHTVVLHDRLVEKLAAGDADGARESMREILERSYNWYSEHGALRSA